MTRNSFCLKRIHSFYLLLIITCPCTYMLIFFILAHVAFFWFAYLHISVRQQYFTNNMFVEDYQDMHIITTIGPSVKFTIHKIKPFFLNILIDQSLRKRRKVQGKINNMSRVCDSVVYHYKSYYIPLYNVFILWQCYNKELINKWFCNTQV